MSRPPSLFARSWGYEEELERGADVNQLAARIVLASQRRDPAAAIARSFSVDPSYVRRVIRYWNEHGTLERWRRIDPLVLNDGEWDRIREFVARPELAFPVRLRPAASVYVGLLIVDFWPGGGKPSGLRGACAALGDAAYQCAHHLVQAASWDCSSSVHALAWLAHRELGLTHYGVREIYIPPQRGWGAVLELLARAKGRSFQSAFFVNPRWSRISEAEYEAENEWIRAELVDRLPAELGSRLTDLGWLCGGPGEGPLPGARWCVEHHGDHEPWTNYWLPSEPRLLPQNADDERLQRHLALLSLAQVFMLFERRARTSLWRRFKMRLVTGKGFGRSPVGSFDEETPYYWQDGRLG
jgi:hypothetical protein